VLAGVDLTLGKTISLDIALQAQEQWKEGKVEVLPQNWTPLNPQFINPDPTILLDFRFRKALLLAIDRQQLADFIFSGHGKIAHSYVGPDVPLNNLVEPSIVKYEYDPRQAAQILQQLGYTKRADGFLYDVSGNKLSVEIRIPLQNDIHAKTAAPVADYWQQLGVAVDQVPEPIQRALDREWRTQHPGFEIVERRNSLLVGEIWRFHSSQVPLPENGYKAT
jgi:ABC-type transport system substrate-binding protein